MFQCQPATLVKRTSLNVYEADIFNLRDTSGHGRAQGVESKDLGRGTADVGIQSSNRRW
jgi:hypothetical protein